MASDVEIVDTSPAASAYAGTLLCLRLLRALLANAAFVIALFALLDVFLLFAMLGAGAGWLILDQPWREVAQRFAIGIVIVSGAIFVQIITAILLIRLYSWALRGSVVVAGGLLTVGVLFLFGASTDLAVHASRAFSGDAAFRGTEVFESARDLFPMYVAVAFIYGSWGLIRLARSGDSLLLLDQPDDEDRRVRIRRVMGIPPIPGQSRPKQRRALGLASLAFMCEGFAFSVYFSNGSLDQVPSMSLELASALVLVFWPLSVAMLYGLLALAQLLWTLARRAAQPSLEESLAADGRPPVLFLRSFTDDQVSLASAHVPLYLRAMDPGIIRHRFEELLILGFERVGPLIAVGNPLDPRPPIGAGRQYLGPGDWQDQVIHHMAWAQCIVVGLSNTEALGWELDQIRERGYLPKVLLVVPPALSSQVADVRMLARRAGLQVEAPNLQGDPDRPDNAPPQHVLACWSSNTDAETIVCSSHLSELDYEIALRYYVTSHFRSRAEV